MFPFNHNRMPAEAIHPGGLLSNELSALNLSVEQAAGLCHCSTNELNAVLNETKPITPELAYRLQETLDLPAQTL